MKFSLHFPLPCCGRIQVKRPQKLDDTSQIELLQEGTAYLLNGAEHSIGHKRLVSSKYAENIHLYTDASHKGNIFQSEYLFRLGFFGEGRKFKAWLTSEQLEREKNVDSSMREE